MESEINKKIEDWEDEILLGCLRAEEMYYLESDKIAESWVSIHKANVIQKIRQLLKQEKEKLIHDHKILVNTILEKKKQEREKLLERIENLEKENKEFKERETEGKNSRRN